MIDREQILYVARLARLRLSDEQVEKMAEELSSVLGHIEKMDELDLTDVAPTSHVVELENVMREDAARPSWPKERMLAEAPDASAEGFRVPSPGS